MDNHIIHATNIVFGAICVGSEAYAIQNSNIVGRIDHVLLGIASVCILEATMFLIIYSAGQLNLPFDKPWHIVCCVGLIGAGALNLCTTVDLQYSDLCKNFNATELSAGRLTKDGSVHNSTGTDRCQAYELKMCAGIVAILNGIIYPFPRKRSSSISTNQTTDEPYTDSL